MDLLDVAARTLLMFIPFLFALCFHEFAHAWVATRRGDTTAEAMGRLTLNPVPHIDLIGTLILPLSAAIFSLPIFFGWAKPVPVDERNLKSPRSDMFWIALAGPLSNALLAVLGAFFQVAALRFWPDGPYTSGLVSLLEYLILINLFLAVFNLLPLHPLDGAKVLARFLPDRWNQMLEGNQQYMGMVLLLLVVSGALAILAAPVYFTKDLLKSLALGILT